MFEHNVKWKKQVMLNVNDLAETHNKRTCFEIKCCKKE